MLLSVLAAAAALAGPVPASAVVAVDTHRALRVVDRSGRTIRRLRWKLPAEVQGIELNADRRGAFVSLWNPDGAPQLFAVDLAAGTRRQIANGISPALSPDKTRLAFLVAQGDTDGRSLTALAIRTLRAGRTRTIAFTPAIPLGTPPELVLNWSPDGRRIAFFNGTRVTVVDAARTAAIPTRVPAGTVRTFAPAFLDRATLVVQVGCCIGRQTLAVVDLRARKRSVFATLSSPVEQVRRIAPGRLLVVTALQELDVVTRGRVHVIVRGVVAAAP